MKPFILYNALHFPVEGNYCAAFLQWLSVHQIDHPLTRVQVTQTIYQPENNRPIFFVHFYFEYTDKVDRENTIKAALDFLLANVKEDSKTDFQIAWKLSLSKDKAFCVADIRKLLGTLDREEISFSKFVEELNTAAYKWKEQNKQPTS